MESIVPIPLKKKQQEAKPPESPPEAKTPETPTEETTNEKLLRITSEMLHGKELPSPDSAEWPNRLTSQQKEKIGEKAYRQANKWAATILDVIRDEKLYPGGK